MDTMTINTTAVMTTRKVKAKVLVTTRKKKRIMMMKTKTKTKMGELMKFVGSLVLQDKYWVPNCWETWSCRTPLVGLQMWIWEVLRIWEPVLVTQGLGMLSLGEARVISRTSQELLQARSMWRTLKMLLLVQQKRLVWETLWQIDSQSTKEPSPNTSPNKQPKEQWVSTKRKKTIILTRVEKRANTANTSTRRRKGSESVGLSQTLPLVLCRTPFSVAFLVTTIWNTLKSSKRHLKIKRRKKMKKTRIVNIEAVMARQAETTTSTSKRRRADSSLRHVEPLRLSSKTNLSALRQKKFSERVSQTTIWTPMMTLLSI
mmetsp:Transcript_22619/g.52205  ORF Transcript_22619/g.52205 Transcript_22619/m.52205 type:complete len:316 (-) Transcript_22619:1093-2040(-)